MESTTPTTIQLSWTSSGTAVNMYIISWKRDATKKCFNDHADNSTIAGDSTTYSITGLEEDSGYIITVTASNAVEIVDSLPVIGMTMKAGKELGYVVILNI